MVDRNPRANELFLRAFEIDSADKRRAFLDAECGSDTDLRQQVESFLQAGAELGDFMNQPAVLIPPQIPPAGEPQIRGPVGDGTTTGDYALITEGPGTVIGPYKLLEQIGEGGFGIVFMVEQTHPVRRKVALKILKPGMDTRQIVARFEVERQALAIMDHPNIAKVHDGGTTPSNRPYFVMELVKGVPITEFCDQNQLTPRQRLELFLPVCHAAQHAHQKGIIHRDLKPSNILVVMHDTKPVPMVIDFGIAKAMGQELTDKTLFTGFAQMVGTPLYMSPEQAGQSGLDLDTRSDIYSLGVVLYELLTGTTPISKERFQKAAYDEIRRIIREEEPPKPSTRLSESKDSLGSISARRQMEPAKLTKQVRGELDWIVMKALEKDRERRYETANGLAQDIQRYLNEELVEACPPSPGYRLRKLIRRHWRGLSAALIFILLLVSAVVTLTVALVTVNRERQAKEAALEAEERRRKQARGALDALSSQFIEDWLAKQPVLLPQHKRFLEHALSYYEDFARDTGQAEETRAGVAESYGRVGFIRERLEQLQDAQVAWERGRELFTELVTDYPDVPAYKSNLARTNLRLAGLYHHTGQNSEAELILGQSLTTYRGLAADFPQDPDYRQDLAIAIHQLGIFLKDRGRSQDSEKAYGEALNIQQQLAADFPKIPDHQERLAKTFGDLGLLQDIEGRSPEAVASLSRAVAIYKQLAADLPTETYYQDGLAINLNNLADKLRAAGRNAEAEEMFQQTLTLRRRLAAEFPAVPIYRRGLAMTLTNLGILLKDTDRASKAEELYVEALAIHKQLAVDFPNVPNYQNEAAGAMVNLARLYLARKELLAARRLLEEAVPFHERALKANPRHPAYRRFYRLNRWRLTETLLEMKDHAAAAATAAQFLQSATEPPRDAYTTACLLAGCVKLATGDLTLSETKRQELSTTYSESALAALRQAIAQNAREVSQMKTDPSLDPLRSRADFRKLLREFPVPSKP